MALFIVSRASLAETADVRTAFTKTLPSTFSEYLHTGLVVATGVLLVAGIAVFWGAKSFEGYISALLIVAVAFASFQSARELKQKDGVSANEVPDIPASASPPDGE